jgi:hypothetical protein
MANHERFTDHMLTGWELSGPPRGVGSRRATFARTGGRAMRSRSRSGERPIPAPARTVEHGTGAKGRRLTKAQHLLGFELPDGGTETRFGSPGTSSLLLERLAWPAVKSVMTRENSWFFI